MEQYVDRMIEEARRIGAEHGANAAAWWEQDAIGGRVPNRDRARECAELTLRGIEDGEPHGARRAASARPVGSRDGFDFLTAFGMELYDAYCEAFDQTMTDVVATYCHAEFDLDGHDHAWGAVQRSRLAGTPHRPCTIEGCDMVSLDLSDDNETEES